MTPPATFSLMPGKRVFFLTKDAELIRRQLAGEFDQRMRNLEIDDLLHDINTDVLFSAWVCFIHRPEDIAPDAKAGMVVDDERVLEQGAARDDGFEVIVSHCRKDISSPRETAAQAERWCGIRHAIVTSFAPIHARNNVNQGVLMGDHAMLLKLEADLRARDSSGSRGGYQGPGAAEPEGAQ